MAKEHTAAGFVLVCTENGERRYLLLKNALHKTWGFPKGHSEAGESLLQTAQRETREETGISELEVIPGFEQRDSYKVTSPKRGSYHKSVTYFLALTPKASHVQSREHSDSAWMSYAEALKHLHFPALRETLRRAEEHLAALKR